MDLPLDRPPTRHSQINDFAIQCFRDTGDADYIAARLAMRSRLAGPFLWSAEQAIEKYLKCILMLNRQQTGDLRHDIRAALKRINDSLTFDIQLSKGEQAIFDHIADWNGDRYLIMSFHLWDREVLQLDKLVWKLRQYCTPLDVSHYADQPSEQVLNENLASLEYRLDAAPKAGHVAGGKLEEIVADKAHPAHRALVWKNLYYSLITRRKVRFSSGLQGVNAPLWLNPELATEAAKWMQIPKATLQAANELARQRLSQDAVQE
jgi:HEPN domain-containing protein